VSERPRIAIHHAFTDAALLRQALTHRSCGTPHNERLEFIGDAVLGLVIARVLYQRFPATPEGKLTRMRAHLVNEDALAGVARSAGLGASMLLGEGEVRSGGAERPSILADAMEAVFGAIFLDAGLDAAARAIEACYGPVLTDIDPEALGKDPKTRLQEWLQARRVAVPAYAVVATTGEAHVQQFHVECRIPERAIVAAGEGSSRRIAEQQAAAAALAALAAGDASSRG
jgi:ribonuclease-3